MLCKGRGPCGLGASSILQRPLLGWRGQEIAASKGWRGRGGCRCRSGSQRRRTRALRIRRGWWCRRWRRAWWLHRWSNTLRAGMKTIAERSKLTPSMITLISLKGLHPMLASHVSYLHGVQFLMIHGNDFLLHLRRYHLFNIMWNIF